MTPDISAIQQRFVYGQRIDSTKQIISDFKQSGVVPTLIGLGTRFGTTNRALARNWGLGR